MRERVREREREREKERERGGGGEGEREGWRLLMLCFAHLGEEHCLIWKSTLFWQLDVIVDPLTLKPQHSIIGKTQHKYNQ